MPAFRDRPSRALYMRDYRRRKREAREAASREAAPVTRAPPGRSSRRPGGMGTGDPDRAAWTPSCRRADGPAALRRGLPEGVMGGARVGPQHVPQKWKIGYLCRALPRLPRGTAADTGENGGEKLVHGSGGIVSLRAEQNSAR